MKNLIFRLLILMALFLPGLAQAQTESTITIGTGTTCSNNSPFNNYYKNAYTQMKYPASGIGQSGYIGAVAFYDTTTASSTPLLFDELTIWMGVSPTTTFSSTTDWVQENSLTQVYHATNVYLPATNGWFQIPLNTPYQYNYGTDSNLVVVISHRATAYSSTIQFKYTSTTNSIMYRRSDSDVSCATFSGTAAGTRALHLPNMQLVMNTTGSFCFAPNNVAVTDRNSSTISINWLSAGATSFQVAFMPSGSSFDATTAQWTNVSDTFYTFTNLTPNTSYDFYVRKACGGNWSSYASLNANTTAVATTIPYTCTFEDNTENASWTFDNSTATNKWVIDTAAHNGENSTHSLYISNDNGATNAYGAFAAHIFSYRPIQITADGDVNYSFDWRCQGYSTTYYMRAALVPTSVQLPAANATTSAITGLTASAMPANWIALDGGSALNLQNTWQTRVGTTRLTQGTYNLVFYWCNSTSATYNPPAAVDNISIEQATCPSIDSVSFTNVSTNSADLTIYSNASNPTYIICYKDKYAASAYDTVIANSNIYNFSNLNHSTLYDIRISTICGSSDTSLAVFNTTLRTECAVVDVFPWDYGFETAWYQSTTSTYPQWPYCWTAFDGGFGSYNWRQYSATTNAHTGDKALLFNGSSSDTVTNNDWMITSQVSLSGSEELSFWMRSASTTATYHARVRVMISDDTLTSLSYANASSFHPLAFNNGDVRTNLSGATATTYQQFFVPLTGYSGNHWIAFVVDTASYNFYIDDIRVKTASNCPDAVNPTVAGLGAYNATLSWSDTSTTNAATSWDLYIGAAGFSADTVNAITVYDTSYALTGLLPQTNYEFYVVAHCTDGSDASATPRVLFTTACAPITTLPFSENFDSYATGSTTDIPCWTRNYYAATTGVYSTTYPQISSSSTYLITGTNSLYFYSYKSTTAENTSYIALPQFATPLDSLRINFNIKRYTSTSNNYYSIVYVGVMSNPNDITTFDTLQVVDVTSLSTGTVLAKEVSFESYEGMGSYITIMAPAPEMEGTTAAYNYVSVDDIVVSLLPSCRRVSDLNVSNITPTSADISWFATTGNNYSVAYSTNAAFNPDTCAALTVTSTTTTLTGLTPYTTYYLKVRTNCSDDTTLWSDTYSFSTPFDCHGDTNIIAIIGTGTSSAITYLLYGSTTYPRGGSWNIFTAQEMMNLGLMSNNTINSVAYKSGTTGGSAAIKIYMAETSLSEFTTAADTVNLNSMQLVYTGTPTFTANQWNDIMLDSVFHYSGVQNLMIAVMRTGVASAASTFTYTTTSPDYKNIYTYTNASGTLYANRTTIRSNIRFNMCTEQPQCNRPDSLTLVGVDSNFVSLSWVGDAAAYQVAYGPAGFNINDATAYSTISATTTTATVTGLNGGTDYNFYVRALCSAIHDSSDWSMVLAAHTPCATMVLPFSENFDTYTGNTAVASAGPVSPCEYRVTNSTSSYPYVYPTYNASAPNSLRFYATTTYYSYFALPRMRDSITNLMVTFELYKTSANYGKMRIGVMTDPNDVSTFSTVACAQPSAINEWEPFEISFANYSGNGRYIAFMLPDSITSYSNLDNIVVDVIPTCPSPVNVAASNITPTSANITWTDRASYPAGYELEYGLSGHVLGTGTIEHPTSNTYTLSGLTPATEYDVYVRSNCSATDSGRWSFQYTFRTACLPISSLPFVMDFENENTGTTAEFPVCWTRINDATGTSNYYPYVSSTSNMAHQGSKALYFYSSTSTTYADNTVAVLPEINTAAHPVSALQLSFFAKTTGTTTPALIVGVMSNPDSLSTFVPVDTLLITDNYENYEVNMNTYGGTGAYPAIKMERQGSINIYVDDITLDVIPTCPRPRNLAQTDATTTTVGLHWTNMSTANNFEVEYTNTLTNTTSSAYATADSVTLTGLTPSTFYTARVRAICGIGDTSDWSSVASATTDCELIDLVGIPYVQNFESYVGNAYNEAGSLPVCWMGISNGSSNIYTPHIVSGAGSYCYTHGDKALIMTSGASTYGSTKFVTLPEFAQQVNTLTMSFWMVTESNTNGTLYVGYLTGLDTSTFVAVDTIHASAASVHSGNGAQSATVGIFDTVSFANAPDSVTHLALKWSHNASYYSVCVDDIVVTTSSNCGTPRDVAVTPTAVTATLNWSAVADFELAYKPHLSNTWSETVYVTNNNTTTFTNLLPNTQYDYRIRRNCGDGAVSSFNYGMFTTMELPCSTPTNLQTTSVAGTTAQLSWTVDAYTHPTNWVLHTFNTTTNIYDTIEATTNSGTITGLIPNITYNVSVKALCAATITSDWSDTINFTTVICQPITNLAQTNVTDTTFSISWTAGSNNSQWEVEYGSAGFGQGEAIGTTIVTTPNATITGLTPRTTYDVHVRAICGDNFYSTWSTLSVTTTLTSISNVVATADITLYPNPTTNATTVTIRGAQGSVHVTIVDMSGRTIKSETLDCHSDCTKTMNVSGLRQGAYFVRVEGEDFNKVKKLIVK